MIFSGFNNKDDHNPVRAMGPMSQVKNDELSKIQFIVKNSLIFFPEHPPLPPPQQNNNKTTMTTKEKRKRQIYK